MQEYHWAQQKLNELTNQPSEERHAGQQHLAWESRAQRRERERQEKKAAKRAKAKA